MRRIISSLLVMLLLTAGNVIAQRGMIVIGKDGVLPEEPYRTKWALLIGINKYPNLPVQYQLHYAENDVKELKKVLLEQYQFPESNITTLVNEQATYNGIREKFAQLSDKNKIDSNDCVLIYFSGHGQTVSKPRGGEIGFLLPYDAKVDMDNVNDISSYYGSCIGMDELKRLAGMIPAKHIIFLVDSCYSGLVVANRGGFKTSIPSYLKKVASVPVQQVITAGMKDDVSSESPEWGHGAFTYKLLEALRTGVADENDDGITTGLELASYLRNVVPNISPKQTPQYGYFEGEGEFLFLREVQPIQPNPDITNPTKESTQTLVDNQSSNNDLPKEITGKDGAKMMLIPAGEFQMGSNDGEDNEKPIHTVYLDAFYVDVYEVSNVQYKKFVDATGHKSSEFLNYSSINAPNEPVGVSWEDAKDYAEWAGERLPTEAEWEKAARGGLVGKKYPWGESLTHDNANIDGTGGKDRWEYNSPVGSFSPNGYGLYDMAGNVWEWCSDWYDDNYYANSPNRNPKGPSSGQYLVLRGGAWSYDPYSPHDPSVYCRYYAGPDVSGNDFGFRCAGNIVQPSDAKTNIPISIGISVGSAVKGPKKAEFTGVVPTYDGGKGKGGKTVGNDPKYNPGNSSGTTRPRFIGDIRGEVAGRKVIFWPRLSEEVKGTKGGSATLEITVDPAGNVTKVEIVKKSGNNTLDRIAMSYVKQIRFEELPKSVQQKDQLGEIIINFEFQ